MKHRIQSLVVLIAVICSLSSFAQQTAESIDSDEPTASDLAQAKSLGIDLDKPYAIARKSLIAAGWVPDMDGVSFTAYSDFPEVVCGTGMAPNCGANFKKSKERLHITVDWIDYETRFVITHIDKN
jgi:hypothetical protein